MTASLAGPIKSIKAGIHHLQACNNNMKNFGHLPLQGTDLSNNALGFDDANGRLTSRTLCQLQFGSGDGNFLDFKIRLIAVRAMGHDASPRRLLEPIGNIPPAEAETAYYAEMGKQAIAA